MTARTIGRSLPGPHRCTRCYVSDYRAEPAFTRVPAVIPTVRDETRVLGGAVGDSLVLARRHGGEWWIAALTDWPPRTLEVPLDFLGPGSWSATLVEDGPSADRYAADHVIRATTLDATCPLRARLRAAASSRGSGRAERRAGRRNRTLTPTPRPWPSGPRRGR